MSEEKWQGWWQPFGAKLFEAGYSDNHYRYILRYSSEKDGFENFVQVELLMPFVSALMEFEKKNSNLLKNITSRVHKHPFNLRNGLEGPWKKNFEFYWRKIQLEEAQGRPIKQIDGKVDWSSVSLHGEVTNEQRYEFEEKITRLKNAGSGENEQDRLYNAFHETEKQQNFWLKHSEQFSKMFIAHTTQWVEKGREEFLSWMEEDREKYWQQAVVVAQEVAAGFAEDLEGVRKRILRDLGGKWWYPVKQFTKYVLPWVIVILGGVQVWLTLRN